VVAVVDGVGDYNSIGNPFDSFHFH
jgi:hypothetical protein